MSLFTKITAVLGYVWTTVFQSAWLTTTMAKLTAYFSGTGFSAWCMSLYNSISVQHLHRTAYTEPVCVLVDMASIRKAYVSPTSSYPQSLLPDTDTTASLWYAECSGMLDDYSHIQNSISEPTYVLLPGIQYYTQCRHSYFRLDPNIFISSTKLLRDYSGTIKRFGLIWCYRKKQLPVRMDIAAALGVSSYLYAQNTAALRDLWRIHQLGAYRYNVQRYLGSCSGSPVSLYSNDNVQAIAAQNGFNCVYTAAAVYSSRSSVSTSVGTALQQGDNIYTGPRVIQSETQFPAVSDMPYLPVNTTVGILQASNSTQPSVLMSDAHYRLSLVGPADRLQLYQTASLASWQDANSAKIQIPASCNPAKFIFTRVQMNRGAILLIPYMQESQLLDSAITQITANIGKGTVLTVLTQTSTLTCFNLALIPSGGIVGQLAN